VARRYHCRSSWLPPGWRPHVVVEPTGRLIVVATVGDQPPARADGFVRGTSRRRTGCAAGYVREAAMVRHVAASFLETVARAWGAHRDRASAREVV
jgi:hypothetical protein